MNIEGGAGGASNAPSDEGRTCRYCGNHVDPLDQFCEGCGSELRVRRGCTADHVGNGVPASCRGCGHDLADHDAVDHGDQFCPECGALRGDGTDHVEIDLGTLAGVSDRGRLHARNEDAMALGERSATADVPGAVAAVVCDGVSSVDRPELASRAATRAALGALLSPRGAGTSARTHVEAAVAAAAEAVAALPYDAGRGAPSCTLVAALVEGAAPEMTVAWVGDSRAYWLCPPGQAGATSAQSSLLTTDHSWAAEMVALGELDEATAAADPRAHAITRWLGADSSDTPSVVELRPDGPGLLLLCSDGLWNYLPDASALAGAAYATGVGPHDVAAELTRYALDCGGHDNITVVAIPIAEPIRTNGTLVRT
ncbi:MAG: protein phosphatase 2C domain-containing protein [Pseudonocardia sp.]|nr:protein phosphatase 2C domain-containing protein [Pseudonocardia sp.]